MYKYAKYIIGLFSMNILFLALDNNLSEYTGDSIHIRELVSSLVKLGNEITLIVADIENKKPVLKWAEDIQNLRLYFSKTDGAFKGQKTVLYCRKIAKEHNVQIIYERRTTPKISYGLNKFLRIPFVIEINALVKHEKALLGKDMDQGGAAKHMKTSFRKHFYKKANKIVCVTQNIKINIQKEYDLPSEKVVTISNGANVDLFSPKNQKMCRKDLGLPLDAPYICFSGNLAPWQGVEYAIEAMPTIIERKSNARLIIVGGGVQKEYLERKASELNLKDHVIFTDRVNYHDVPKYINATDICVAPMTTGREKSGSSAIKIYEYLACGKPVIASNVPNIEFIQKNDCGLLVPKDDPDAMSKAIITLLNDPERRMKMGERGRKLVVENYSWINTARKITDMLETLI
jgi:glycosyltransferase involved in cell wall biosynthesis